MEFTVNGKGVFAATGGRPFDGSRPTILFVHGAGMDHSVWALQTRYFAWRDHNVLAVDLPGHGRTEGPLLGGVGEMADWIIALLDNEKIDKAALVGHSMGSLIALDTAARYPGRVSALALLGTSVPMPVAGTLLSAARNNDHAALDMVNIWGLSRAAQIGGSRVPGHWMSGDGVRLLERAGPDVLHNDLAACDAYRDGETLAGTISCPVLLLLGEYDIMTPARNAAALGAMLPRAKTEVIGDCGHMMMVEKPDEVLDALISFL